MYLSTVASPLIEPAEFPTLAVPVLSDFKVKLPLVVNVPEEIEKPQPGLTVILPVALTVLEELNVKLVPEF